MGEGERNGERKKKRINSRAVTQLGDVNTKGVNKDFLI